MKIRMKSTQYIAPDGINAHTYEVGEEYEVGTAEMPEDIAVALLVDGRAEEVKPKITVHVDEEKLKEEEPKRTGRPPGPSEIKKR